MKLTKEEYFASLAMPVMLKYALENGIGNIFETVAIDSMNMAKAMIERAELNRKNQEEDDEEINVQLN